MSKIADWFKRNLGGGISIVEGETENGSTCSFKMKKIGKKTREIFEKIGETECIEALKQKMKHAED